MSTYDRELSLLRRRLILALKHPKVYMDSMHIEYTGAEFEGHVRPSYPFTADEINLGEIGAKLTVSSSPSSNPTEWKENLEMGFDANVGSPTVLKLKPSIDVGQFSGMSLDEVYLTKPTDVGFENIGAMVDMSGTITPSSSTLMGGATNMEYDMSATVNFVHMPALNPETIEVVADVSGVIDMVRTLDMQSNTEIYAGASGFANINLYTRATLAKLNDLTLETLADMPLNVGYISYNASTLTDVEYATI